MLDIETAKELLGGLLLQLCLMGAFAFLGAGVICCLWRFCRKRLGGLWLRSRSQFVSLAIAAGIATGVAQKSTNNVPPNMNSPLPQMMQGGTSFQTGFTGLPFPVTHSPFPVPNPVQNHISGQVTSDDIVRGYRIESVTTNSEPFAAMPSNAVEYAQWSLRGGREMWFPLEFGGFEFPLGTNRVRRLRVLSGGMVETFSPNEPAAICAAREYASLIPGYSRFQWADSDDGVEKTLRWEGVYANRDRTGEYDAEIRFYANGDFTTRSNDVETVCRRVNPDDWDDDGIHNERDLNPTSYDGDFFGVANALPTNANPDAYYWLDLSTTGLLGVATIRVTCDGPSDLGDHVVVARTNQVCHVPLLAGATYAVESDLPIDYSAVSSEYAEIVTNAENNLIVSLPLELTFERVQMRGGFDIYVAHTSPVDVGPRILNIAGGCCSCVTNDFGFSWFCSDGCNCGGYWHDLEAATMWGGYSHSFGWSGWCPCIWHEEGGQHGEAPRLVLDVPRTLFTNNDGGAEPSDVVHLAAGLFSPVETNGTLTLDVGLGEFVNVWTTSNRTGRVNLPVTWNVANEPCHNFYIEGAEEIGRGIDAFILTWRDGTGNAILSTNVDFAVYYPKVNVVNNSLFDDGDLCNPAGIVTGTNACFAIEFGDVHPPANEIKWSIAEGDAQFVGGDTGECVRVASTVADQRVKLRVQVDDCRSRPPEISAHVVDPLAVKLTVWIVGNKDGSHYAKDVATVSNMVADVNKIYEQMCVVLS